MSKFYLHLITTLVQAEDRPHTVETLPQKMVNILKTEHLLIFKISCLSNAYLCLCERGTLSAALPLRLMTAQTQLTPRAPPKTDYLRFACKDDLIKG